MSLLNITVMRHGHAYNQTLDILAGCSDFPLTQRGLDQAENVMSRYGNMLSEIDSIYCSDITRCVQTISPFYEKFNGASLFIDKALREINVGSDYAKKYNDIICEGPMLDFGYSSKRSFDGGESMSDFILRIKNFLNDLPRDKNILLVTHSGVINVLMHEKFEIDYSLFPFFNIRNCYPYQLSLL